MRIAVTGGNEYAEFFPGVLAAGKNRVTVIDRGKEFYERVYGAYNADAILDDPCQKCVLEEAGIKNFDVIVALGPEDTDNLEICQMGKKIFGTRKTLYLVRNPRSVELSEKLGVDQAASIPVTIARMLQGVFDR